MTNTKISEILNDKGAHVFHIDASASVMEAAGKMVDSKVGSLLVMKGDNIAGIVTERDCMRHMARSDGPSDLTRVSDIMTRDVVAVTPESTAQECMAIMTERRVRHLPVTHEGRLVGLISIGDLVKRAAADRRVEIHYLTEYIIGNYPGIEARGKSVFA